MFVLEVKPLVILSCRGFEEQDGSGREFRREYVGTWEGILEEIYGKGL